MSADEYSREDDTVKNMKKSSIQIVGSSQNSGKQDVGGMKTIDQHEIDYQSNKGAMGGGQ